MTKQKVIEITLQLTCDDKGLDINKVALGYLENIALMHDKEYVEKKHGNRTERVKMLSGSVTHKEITLY